MADLSNVLQPKILSHSCKLNKNASKVTVTSFKKFDFFYYAEQIYADD